MLKDLKNKTIEELEELVTSLGQKKYLAKYIFSFIHTNHAADISKLSPLSKAFRVQLANEGFFISSLKIIEKFVDPDGTIKYLFEFTDGNRIETVLLFDGRRKTLCISTQVGCAMNCAFCATAKIKLKRNLTAGEILDQVYSAEDDNCKVTNVVYMGMGEPLNNYDNVLKSVKILNDPAGRNLGLRHITISTCGQAEAIKTLACESIQPRLAVSLNAPTDTIRTKLMPINKRYPLKALFDSIRLYQRKTKQRVTFEYVMIENVNDKDAHAHQLVELLKGIKCNLNLIEYNPHPGCSFKPSPKTNIEQFAGIVAKSGIETVIRAKKGQEIKAACGQLGAQWLKK
jgi:23S rRNA (adenine2503-C2)-methyltransferase